MNIPIRDLAKANFIHPVSYLVPGDLVRWHSDSVCKGSGLLGRNLIIEGTPFACWHLGNIWAFHQPRTLPQILAFPGSRIRTEVLYDPSKTMGLVCLHNDVCTCQWLAMNLSITILFLCSPEKHWRTQCIYSGSSSPGPLPLELSPGESVPVENPPRFSRGVATLHYKNTWAPKNGEHYWECILPLGFT